MNSNATIASQYATCSRNCDDSSPMPTAPSSAPYGLLRPPTAVQITNSADSTKPVASGVTRPCCGA